MSDRQEDDTTFPASPRVQGQADSRRAYALLLERLEAYPWWQEFQEIMGLGWDWRKAVYIAWAASPARGRFPPTQQLLATEVLGLRDDRTIRTWRKRHPDMEQTIAMLQASPLLRHRRDIYDALAQSAADPDPKSHSDRKLALEMMGDYKPRASADVSLSGHVVGVTLEEWQGLTEARRAAADETLAIFAAPVDDPDEDADETGEDG